MVIDLNFILNPPPFKKRKKFKGDVRESWGGLEGQIEQMTGVNVAQQVCCLCLRCSRGCRQTKHNVFLHMWLEITTMQFTPVCDYLDTEAALPDGLVSQHLCCSLAASPLP